MRRDVLRNCAHVFVFSVSRISYHPIKVSTYQGRQAQSGGSTDVCGSVCKIPPSLGGGPTPKRTQGGARCLNDTPLRPGKQREGVTRPIPVRFDPHRLQFEEVVTEAQDTAAD